MGKKSHSVLRKWLKIRRFLRTADGEGKTKHPKGEGFYPRDSRNTSTMEGKVFFRKGGRLDLATQAALLMSSSRWGVRLVGSV